MRENLIFLDSTWCIYMKFWLKLVQVGTRSTPVHFLFFILIYNLIVFVRLFVLFCLFSFHSSQYFSQLLAALLSPDLDQALITGYRLASAPFSIPAYTLFPSFPNNSKTPTILSYFSSMIPCPRKTVFQTHSYSF